MILQSSLLLLFFKQAPISFFSLDLCSLSVLESKGGKSSRNSGIGPPYIGNRVDFGLVRFNLNWAATVDATRIRWMRLASDGLQERAVRVASQVALGLDATRTR